MAIPNNSQSISHVFSEKHQCSEKVKDGLEYQRDKEVWLLLRLETRFSCFKDTFSGLSYRGFCGVMRQKILSDRRNTNILRIKLAEMPKQYMGKNVNEIDKKRSRNRRRTWLWKNGRTTETLKMRRENNKEGRKKKGNRKKKKAFQSQKSKWTSLGSLVLEFCFRRNTFQV